MVFLYSSDIGYANISKISIASLLEANKGEGIRIYYIEDQIGEENKKWLTELVHRYNAEIIYIDSKKIDTSFIQKTAYPAAGYYRLLVSDLIQEEKIIYLDCDTIILNSFHNLWEADLSDYLVAGVKDTVQNHVATSVGLEDNSQYINAGMLYINLEKWRKENVNIKICKVFSDYAGKVPHHDQGVVNSVAYGKILYLPVQYNLMSQYLYFQRRELVSLFRLKDFYSEREIAEAKEKPIVIHFLNKFYGRPWISNSNHPYVAVFDDFAKKHEVCLNKQNKPTDRGVMIRKKLYEHAPFPVYLLLERCLDLKRRVVFRKEYGI